MSFPSKQILSRSTPLNRHPRVVVIGASSGIGAAVAEHLGRLGCRLALLARREEKLKRLCQIINQQAGEKRAVYYVHDVANYTEVQPLLQRIISDLGGLDIFIFCAGITPAPGLRNYDQEKDFQTVGTNFLGALAWLNPVAVIFQQLKAGHIVGISSVAGERGRVGNPAYNASKAALTCYLEALRNRLSRYGVHVLTIKPGLVQTDSLKDVKTTFLAITPEQAAEGICKAIHSRKQEAYVPSLWRWVMLIIRNIPSFIFRRLSI